MCINAKEGFAFISKISLLCSVHPCKMKVNLFLNTTVLKMNILIKPKNNIFLGRHSTTAFNCCWQFQAPFPWKRAASTKTADCIFGSSAPKAPKVFWRKVSSHIVSDLAAVYFRSVPQASPLIVSLPAQNLSVCANMSFFCRRNLKDWDSSQSCWHRVLPVCWLVPDESDL